MNHCGICAPKRTLLVTISITHVALDTVQCRPLHQCQYWMRYTCWIADCYINRFI